jgi:hypothetical protein
MSAITESDLALLRFVARNGPVDLQGEVRVRAAYLEDQGLLACVPVRRFPFRRQAWTLTPAGETLVRNADAQS